MFWVRHVNKNIYMKWKPKPRSNVIKQPYEKYTNVYSGHNNFVVGSFSPSGFTPNQTEQQPQQEKKNTRTVPWWLLSYVIVELIWKTLLENI